MGMATASCTNVKNPNTPALLLCLNLSEDATYLPSIPYTLNNGLFIGTSADMAEGGNCMNNLGASLARLIALTVGAAVGVILANLYDKLYSEHVEEQSQRDKAHYERGLPAIERRRTNPIEYVKEYQEGPEV